jgi:hypothetical protein
MEGYAPSLERPRRAETPEPAVRGPFTPALALVRPSWWTHVRPWAPFLAVVILPTLIVAAYYFLIAADQ